MQRLDFRRREKIVLPTHRPSVVFNLCIETRAMGCGDMGHVFQHAQHPLLLHNRREKEKQYANPVGFEQIADVKTDMVVGLTEKNQQKAGWPGLNVNGKGKLAGKTNKTRCFQFTYNNPEQQSLKSAASNKTR